MTDEQYNKLIAMLYATQALVSATAKQVDPGALLADFRTEGKRLQDSLLNTATVCTLRKGRKVT